MHLLTKMDSTLTKIQQNVDSIIKYLTPLLPLANCHMVEFITQNHWQNLLPKAVTENLENMELNDAVNTFWNSATGVTDSIGNKDLVGWIKTARLHCVQPNNEYCLTKEQFKDRIRSWGGKIKSEIQVKEFMSSKKSYEVQSMCSLVASIHEVCRTKCCVEAGGGRGPLLTALSLSYGVPSLTVDCDETAVRAAEKRSRVMKKQWHAIAKRVDGSSEESSNQENNLHRFASAFVTSGTDLASIARERFPEYDDEGFRVLLTGLHTCGNLGPDSLRIFTHQPSTGAVFNVPCCYHLLTEDTDEEFIDVFQRDYGPVENSSVNVGFPMSEYLKGFRLGRNARMLAAQSIDRVVHCKQLPATSLLYRALLQVIIKTHLPNAALSEGRLKRISKCVTFEQYFKMADSILQLNLFDTLPQKYLEQLQKQTDEQWKKLILFYLLRLCLAQVIESVVLLDRLLYLKENGCQNVFLVKLFDPVMSPRCHSIVAIRQ